MASKGNPGVVNGDEVYAHHPKAGPIAGRVVAHGLDGFTVDTEGSRHQLGWPALLGMKSRVSPAYEVVDSGADGAILEDATGKRRFVRHSAPMEEPDEPERDDSPEPDDPLTDGVDQLAKAQAVAGRAGLALTNVTDKGGHQTKRWTKTQKDAPGARKPGQGAAAPMRHGDTVNFRHGDVQGTGKIVASGVDGVTVHDGQREHRVRHEHLTGPVAVAKPPSRKSAPRSASGTGAPTGGTGGAPGGGSSGSEPPGGGEDGLIPPDKFNAAAFALQHNDPNVTPADVLKAFPPGTAAKLAEICKKLEGAKQTVEIFKKDGVYTSERKALHQKIIDTFLSGERAAAATPAEGERPSFTILGGRGGSGKSSFKGQVYDPDKAIVIDADAIKEMLPEYQGWNAALVHEESGDLFDDITEKAKGIRLNIVHDATMKTAHKAVALVKSFKDDGYQTAAHYMYLPPEEAAKRAVSRFLGPTQRFVPPGIVLGNTTNEGSFDQIKGLVDSWSFRDNNVAKGSAPRLISESENETYRRKSGLHGLPAANRSGHGDRDLGTDKEADRAGAGKTPFGKALTVDQSGGITDQIAARGGRAMPLPLFFKAVGAGRIVRQT